TGVAAPNTAQQIIDAAGTADSIAGVPTAVNLAAATAQPGLTRLGQAGNIVDNLVQTLGELLVHQIIAGQAGRRSTGSNQLQSGLSDRGVRNAFAAGLRSAAGFLPGLGRRIGLFLLFLVHLLFDFAELHHHLRGVFLVGG